jgi:hypothetical protein
MKGRGGAMGEEGAVDEEMKGGAMGEEGRGLWMRK